MLEGAKNYDLDTNGAVTDSETLATLSSDGDAYYVETTVVGKTSSAGEVVVAEASGVFYRAGGTVLKLAPVHTVSEVGLAGADADLVINSDDVDLTVTGVAAKVIAWTVLTRKVVELRSP